MEIVEYLRGLLDKYSNPALEEGNYFGVDKVVDLFNRLQDFYWRWCDGIFIDADGTTLPQTKQRELKPYVGEDANLGQRQVDVLTGLNVMILLLELHRYGIDSEDEELKQQLNFHPRGEVDEEGKPKDKHLLLKIIGCSDCLGITGFVDTVGNFLYKANLENAEPDLAIVKNPPERYINHHPYQEEILWLIEVSQSTLNYDLTDKKRTYARNKIEEYWIIDLRNTQLYVFRNPVGENYQLESILTEGKLTSLAFPNIEISVNKMLNIV